MYVYDIHQCTGGNLTVASDLVSLEYLILEFRYSFLLTN